MPLFGTRGAASVTGFGGLAKLGYLLRNSLRFRASNSNYLDRTFPSAGNRKTYTLSLWVKRGNLGGSTTQFFFGSGLSTTAGGFYFTATDNIEVNPRVNNTNTFLTTTQVFRDPSAWYHIVFALDTTQATDSNRMKLYVNGVQVTAFSTASYPALNGDSTLNNNIAHWIGRYAEVGFPSPFDGYLAEYNFIDGLALTPSSFGKTDGATGQWVPKKFGGPYGTNGFYLPFTNTTSTSTLGNDFSGNGNTWTVNNISLTAGATYDSMIDVPTLSPEASNYATLNPLYVHYPWTASVPTNGNLFNPAGSHSVAVATQVLSGKMYWEVSIGNPNQIVGIINPNSTYTGTFSYDDPSAKGIYTYTMAGYVNGSGIQSPGGPIGSQSGAHTYMFAVDIPNGLMWAGINGTFNGNPSAGTGAFWNNLLSTIQYSPWIHSAATNESNTANVNFGQRPFAYTPPTGFKSLNAYNLP